MGEIDYGNLYEIYRKCVDYCKAEKIPITLKVDSGTYETAIEFWAIGYHHPPKSKSWKEVKKQGNEIKCPDILDFENKFIIELEEEPTPGKIGGKMGKKGHTSESDTDEHRDMLYRIAGFRLCKIWESEFTSNKYNQRLYQFLHEVYKVPQNSKMCHRNN